MARWFDDAGPTHAHCVRCGWVPYEPGPRGGMPALCPRCPPPEPRERKRVSGPLFNNDNKDEVK